MRRILLAILSLISVVVLISSLLFLSPVDPARLTFGQQFSEEALQSKRATLGLDDPLYLQVGKYIRDISPIWVGKSLPAHLSTTQVVCVGSFLCLKKPYLRESYQTGHEVWSMIAKALPSTICLALSSILLAFILGVSLGYLAAINKDNWLDDLLVFISTLGYSVPSYVSAIFFALLFGFVLKHITGLNVQGGLWVLNDFGDYQFMLKNLILPTLALGIRPVSVILQVTRSAVLDKLDAPYVLMASAKGLAPSAIRRGYVLRNAWNPILTATSGWFASLLSGSFFVESVFNFRGFGQLTVNALLNYDVPLLLGCILVVSLIFILLNLVMDWMYRRLDPRVTS